MTDDINYATKQDGMNTLCWALDAEGCNHHMMSEFSAGDFIV